MNSIVAAPVQQVQHGSQGSAAFSRIFGSLSEGPMQQPPAHHLSHSYTGIPTSSAPQYMTNFSRVATLGSFSGARSSIQDSAPTNPVLGKTLPFGSMTPGNSFLYSVPNKRVIEQNNQAKMAAPQNQDQDDMDMQDTNEWTNFHG